VSTRVDTYIAGVKRLPVFFKYTEDIMLPHSFELEIEPQASYGVLNDLVEFKRLETSTLEFTGVIEKRGLVDSEDETIRVSGRDQGSVKLMQYPLDRETFLGTEPARILDCLIYNALAQAAGMTQIGYVFSDGFVGDVAGEPAQTGDWFWRRGHWKKGSGSFEGWDTATRDPSNEFNNLCWFARRNVAAENKTNYAVFARVKPVSRGSGGVSDTDMEGTRTGLTLYETYDGSAEGIPGQGYSICMYAGVFFRDPSTHSRWIELIKSYGSSWSRMGNTDYAWEWGKEYHLCWQVNGTNISFRILNENKEFSVNNTAEWTSARAGCMFGLTRAEFRDFYVRDLLTITASGTATGYDKEAVCDGSLFSAWKENTAGWIKINYLAAKSIARIDVIADIPTAGAPMKIETSPNDSTWTTRYDNATHKGKHAVAVFAAASIQYVRVTQASGTPYPIREIRVYPAQSGQVITKGTVSTYGSPIQFRADYEQLYTAVLRLARQLAWNAYIGPDGTLNMVSERGSDLSGSVLFARGSNLFGATRELEGTELDWKVKALGRGEGAAQLTSTKTDAAVLTAYPNLAKSRIYPDKTFDDVNLLSTWAQTILTANSTPRDRIMAVLDDTYAAGTWRAGDLIHLHNSILGVDGNYRVLRVTRYMMGGLDYAEIEAYPASQMKLPEYRDLSDLLVDIVNRIKPLERTPQSG
jgi:hypothetical protein